MARLYYRVKLEGLLAFRGVLKRVERFDDSPRVQNWYDKLTVGCSKTSRHLLITIGDKSIIFFVGGWSCDILGVIFTRG